MDIQNMKNIVIIKNLPSNMIEEAFVILKDNVKIHKQELVGNKKTNDENKKNNNRDYLIKEAELILADYADRVETKLCTSKRKNIKLEEKCKKLKYSTMFFAVLSLISIISIILR